MRLFFCLLVAYFTFIILWQKSVRLCHIQNTIYTSKATLEATTLTATMWTKCLPVMRVSQSTCLLTASAFKRHGDVTAHFVGTNASTATIAGIVKDNVSHANRRWRWQTPSHGTQGLDYAPCTKSSALDCRQYMVLDARKSRLALRPPRCVLIFLLTLTLRTSFAHRTQGTTG